MKKLSKQTVIKRGIKPGTYVRSELKTKLEELYDIHGINENAKATDVTDVYHMRPTTMKAYRLSSGTNRTRVVPAVIVEPYY